MRHFTDIATLDAPSLRRILDDACVRKQQREGATRGKIDEDRPLEGRIMAMIFEKPSTRTRVSFDVAMRQLGGQTIEMSGSEMQLGRGETVADTARVLSGYVDAIMIRTSKHSILEELAEAATVPVINGLTDRSHPCQVMGDIMTFEEHRGPIRGSKVAWLGDGNNMANSWIEAAVRFDFELELACPEEFWPDPAVLHWAKSEGGTIGVTRHAATAAARADCIATDVWVSMNDESADGASTANVRHNLLKPYRVDELIMAAAHPDAIFMHCLPAHRGQEVMADVIDGPRSVVWAEAENRLHAQKGILNWCMT